MKHKHKTWLTGYLLISPFIVGFLVFYFVPYVLSIGLSFTRGIGNRSFVGLSNYISLFKSEAFLLAGKNTLTFTAVAIPMIFIISLLFALFLNEKLKKIEVFRSIFIVPLILPTASVILFWQIIFEDKGIINLLINKIGMGEISFLNSDYSMLVVIIIYIWKYAGYNIILLLSGLNSISREYYENAQIDGASKFKSFYLITLPLLAPISFLVLILSFINSLKIYREIYLLAGSYPHERIYMLQHFMNNNFRNLNYQRLTSASTLISIIIIGVIIFLYYRQRKADVT